MFSSLFASESDLKSDSFPFNVFFSFTGRNDSFESMAYSDTGTQYSMLIDKQPIVCADGLMMKCAIVDNSYVPQQIINFEEFIWSIKRAIEVLKTPDSSPVSFGTT